MSALDVSCPECHARKNYPCRYIEPKAPHGTRAWREQSERAGKLTKRPHTERYSKAISRRLADLEVERRAANAASPERAAVLRANGQAVADEQHQLIAWLGQHASILTTH